MEAPAIVVVDDEAYQRQVLAEFLARNGLRPTTLAAGSELKRLAQQSMPDVVLLDVRLGEAENGFDLARWLRARSARVGIIMLTAAGDTVDRVLGLESGADDYVTKPFEPAELLARVRAQLRRAHHAASPSAHQPQLRVGAAILDEHDPGRLVGAGRGGRGEEVVVVGGGRAVPGLVEHVEVEVVLVDDGVDPGDELAEVRDVVGVGLRGVLAPSALHEGEG